MITWLSLIICIAGVVTYGISANTKAQAVALHMFWVGLLVFLFHFDHLIQILER